ncbi:hypothetical protein PI124_g11597 [Phytophthora idaei]|nr:hypothetical protein PI125_g3475 [Phytophthora idaei]KAG3167788.1 hypothetical protein PI126_g3644 [Phytophthora idaei]KAG3243585.1 hypothetical protein PI124_g11597 [Phytophthora idaei]
MIIGDSQGNNKDSEISVAVVPDQEEAEDEEKDSRVHTDPVVEADPSTPRLKAKSNEKPTTKMEMEPLTPSKRYGRPRKDRAAPAAQIRQERKE